MMGVSIPATDGRQTGYDTLCRILRVRCEKFKRGGRICREKVS